MTVDGADEVMRYADNVPVSPEEAVAASIEFVGLPKRRGAFKQLLRRPTTAIAIGYLVVLTAGALLAPAIAPYDPNDLDIPNRLATPSWSHLLGTDDLGRDLFSRLLYGARVSVFVSVIVVAIAMTASMVVGLFSGYVGGSVDNLLMRITDAGLSFPALVLAIAIAGVLGPQEIEIPPGGGEYALTLPGSVIVALSVVFVFGLIRLVRGTTLAVREEPFVEASRAAGSSTTRILGHRILPNVRSPLIIAATFGLSALLIAEAGLAYLGVGLPPPTASWGGMLRNAYDRSLYQAAWQIFVPGLAIAITVFAFVIVGEGLRDALGRGRTGKRRRSERRGLTAVVREHAAPPSVPLASTHAVGPSVSPGGSASEALPAALPEPLLSIEHLSVEFVTAQGAARVVDDVSLRIAPGELVGLVGESGSGKTVTALSVMRLVPSPPGQIVSGAIHFGGQDLLGASFDDMRALRGSEISMIFQDPMTSLDPTFTIGSMLREAQQLHSKVSKAEARERSIELLDMVGVPAPDARLRQYPHQLSGGLRQRVMIAVALANRPKLLIADEPTTALDVTIQAQVLDLLRTLQRELGMAVLFVTHDLGVIADLCDRVAVMYAGQIVEEAPVHELYEHPQHPYTEGLLGAMPQVGQVDQRLTVIPGQVPLPHEMPAGCRFARRCAYAIDVCEEPVPLELRGAGLVRCARVSDLTLKAAE